VNIYQSYRKFKTGVPFFGTPCIAFNSLSDLQTVPAASTVTAAAEIVVRLSVLSRILVVFLWWKYSQAYLGLNKWTYLTGLVHGRTSTTSDSGVGSLLSTGRQWFSCPSWLWPLAILWMLTS